MLLSLVEHKVSGETRSSVTRPATRLSVVVVRGDAQRLPAVAVTATRF